LLLAAITLPLVVVLEEVIFRGLLLRYALRIMPATVAIPAVAALHSIAHGWYAGFWVRAFFLTTIGIIYVRTHSLWAAIVAHFAIDVVLFAAIGIALLRS
jgi:membrane protease YdiL (CAAX protease family)